MGEFPTGVLAQVLKLAMLLGVTAYDKPSLPVDFAANFSFSIIEKLLYTRSITHCISLMALCHSECSIVKIQYTLNVWVLVNDLLPVLAHGC